MKISTYLFLLVFLPIFTFSQDELNYPIDIVYHSATENYYVSNWADGDGYILKLDKEGSIVETFYDGLHFAGGLCIVDDVLYIIDNYDFYVESFLIGIDLNSGNPILLKKVSSGTTNLNFMAYAHGNIYITDDKQSKIYKYNIEENLVSDFLTNLNSPPFGICYDYYSDRLLFTENGPDWSNLSYLNSINPSGGDITTPYEAENYIKGVIMHPNADFYYTIWQAQDPLIWGDEEVRMVVNNFSWGHTLGYNHYQPWGLCIGYDNHLVVCNYGSHSLSFYDLDTYGVDEIVDKSEDFTIFPNPTNGKFNIGFSDNVTSNLEITILNITGQQVYQEKMNNSNVLADKGFDLQGLPAGTYVVILKDDRSVFQKKLIIN
ncbi:MAG: T9SS type A sorting domain-containing protein [Bacteroidales bacterium]|nr:T9SS type A sorting domain-containing protein [Bacteroidales bacterium]